jgi:acyl-coenzyme A thioesterase PaaI-like protein
MSGPAMSQNSKAGSAALKLVSAGEGKATGTLRAWRNGRDQPGSRANDAIGALVQATAAAAIGCNIETLSDLYLTYVRRSAEHPLTAEAQAMRQGDKLQSCEVEVRDWNGDLVAKALLSFCL